MQMAFNTGAQSHGGAGGAQATNAAHQMMRAAPNAGLAGQQQRQLVGAGGGAQAQLGGTTGVRMSANLAPVNAVGSSLQSLKDQAGAWR